MPFNANCHQKKRGTEPLITQENKASIGSSKGHKWYVGIHIWTAEVMFYDLSAAVQRSAGMKQNRKLRHFTVKRLREQAAVAFYELTSDYLKFIIQIGTFLSWQSRTLAPPAHSLFLHVSPFTPVILFPPTRCRQTFSLTHLLISVLFLQLLSLPSLLKQVFQQVYDSGLYLTLIRIIWMFVTFWKLAFLTSRLQTSF